MRVKNEKVTLKRAASLAMASAMVFSLAACGNGGEDKKGSSSGEAVPTIDQVIPYRMETIRRL